jgi:hypothetical protein
VINTRENQLTEIKGLTGSSPSLINPVAFRLVVGKSPGELGKTSYSMTEKGKRERRRGQSPTRLFEGTSPMT